MKKLLNTLYVTTPETYLALDGENVVVYLNDEKKLRLPLHTLESIAYFGYKGASPALIGACVAHGVRLSFLSQSGRFLAAAVGQESGNVLLRRTQYRIADDAVASVRIARGFIMGKLYNSRRILERAIRDHGLRLDANAIRASCTVLSEQLSKVAICQDMESLRGLEGSASERYFSHFDDMILAEKDAFRFPGRNRRPPLDPVNAMLSFAYVLLAGSCASALYQVGLDPYVGFLHKDRPGRTSLALDLMEEFRSILADRLVLTLINNREVRSDDFEKKENGAVLLSDKARKALLSAWQRKKQDTFLHPYLKEKIPWGLAPYVQALLLARFLRGDLDAYPPLFWK